MAKDKNTKKENELIEKIDFQSFLETGKTVHIHEKDHILPVVAIITVGLIALGLVVLYFYMTIKIDVFKDISSHLAPEELVDNYFSFQQRIIGQVAQIGGYIYAPIVPMLGIIVWNYIQKRK
ncbi:MAG: hypothetical protein KAR21_23375 [Spirochaetales bacterium]|nr:hypothetical protein [Spirochaetales bacterium]